ncbi:RNA splicing protein mrs2 [Hibiscus syriacus]|uniref:Hexosyltransferase n=1 Tax=Hibiscus syriacus TaxID=106335 RepID=A0A6A3AHH7_HIBSY|nr:RNA splicing protein mrs2 [Hibiscus syriacus]
MKKCRHWQRILILFFLSFFVFAQFELVSQRLKAIAFTGGNDFVGDLASIKYMADDIRLNAIEQETAKGLKGPKVVVFKKNDFSSTVHHISVGNHDSDRSRDPKDADILLEAEDSETYGKGKGEHPNMQNIIRMNSREKVYSHNQRFQSQSRKVTDEKVKQMRDQVIIAKVYLNFAQPGHNTHLLKELRTRIKEVERTVEEAYLVQLAARTTPKGLHCLSMQLTAEYFSLQPEERRFPNQKKLNDPDLYLYAVFSDNVLACAVVINSTISSAKELEKIVFHVVTDYLNLPAISMWFLLNPPGKATIHIQSVESFDWLSTKYNSTLKEQKSYDPRFTSALNHLRFYLPDIFPALNKIVLFDHDVVVQRDLTEIWSVDMKGKVNAAVETCLESEASFRTMHMLLNFSNPFLAKRFNANACTWAFGMNLFDLQEWRRKKLTMLYRSYLQLGLKRPLWKAGSLPLGWITFYNETVALERRWHALGLGYNSGLWRGDIEQAAVIHYDGVMKPWLEIGITKYKGYWSKHLQYNLPYLQKCNIHE